MKKFVSKLPTIIGIIVSVILAPFLIMNVTIIVKSYINPDKVPDFFGIKPFVVVSGSMEPTIMVNDVVIVKTVKPETLEIGDVISFREGKSVITHRIFEKTEVDGQPAFITKGDWFGASPDTNPVTYSQVEGKYIFRVQRLGSVAMFLQTPVGMLTFIGIPIIGFILFDIIRRQMQKRKQDKEGDEKLAELEELKAKLLAMENANGDGAENKDAEAAGPENADTEVANENNDETTG